MKVVILLLLVWLAWRLFRAMWLAFDDVVTECEDAWEALCDRMRAKHPTLTAPVGQLAARGIRRLFR